MSSISWLFIAVLSSATYAVTNFIDKYILDRKIRDYRGLVIYTTIVSLIFGIFFWLLAGLPILAFREAAVLGISGVFTIGGLALYFRALSLEETSIIIILMQLAPLIVLLLSVTILQEKVSNAQLAGFLFIFSGAIGVSLTRKDLNINFSKALFFILIADLLWASANVLFKFTLLSATFLETVPFESFGIAIGGLLIYLLSPSTRCAFSKMHKSVSKSGLIFIVLNEIIFLSAKFLGFYAISLGPVSLVSIVGSTQIFFGVLYGWILTLIRKEFHEDISLSGIARKLCMSLIIFIGIWFMNY